MSHTDREGALGRAVRLVVGCRVRDSGPMGIGRVLGIDACKRGWIAIAVEDGISGAYFAEDIQMLIARAEADAGSR